MNLAKLSSEKKAAMELHKAVCLARYNCTGKSRYECEAHIKTLSKDVQDEIARLIKEKVKA